MFQTKFSFRLNFKTRVWDWGFCNREIPLGLQDHVEDEIFDNNAGIICSVSCMQIYCTVKPL